MNSYKKGNRKKREPAGKRLAKRLKGIFKATMIIVSICSIFYGGWWMYEFVFSTPLLNIKEIVVSGGKRVTREDIIGLSGISQGDNLIAVNSKIVMMRIKKEPWIETVKIRKKIPDRLIIEVSERRPVAMVNMEDLYLMDINGVLFKRAFAHDEVDLPIITGLYQHNLSDEIESKRMFKVIDLINNLSSRKTIDLDAISEINVSEDGELVIYTLNESIKIEVGADAFEEKLDKLDRIIARRSGDLRGIEYIDLNNSRGAVVRFSSASGINI